jgi:gentisate 1,2-dioxygenase
MICGRLSIGRRRQWRFEKERNEVSAQLGTLEELPQDYREAMARASIGPLWPQLRNAFPHGAPKAVTQPNLWNYSTIRPLLMRAGELTPVEKAERRVLFLIDPGRGAAAMQVTSTLYVGFQLLMPGETAPAHKHTPSAARIVVEGEGAYTVVDGEKLPMAAGDLILTPGGAWHDHGHGGTRPVVWLDALDLPLFVYLEASYALEAALQTPRNRPDSSEVEYLSAGLAPSRRHDQGHAKAYPMMRYPWARTEAALRHMADHNGAGIAELDYINPETGENCLKTIGFTAMMLPPGQTSRPPLRSCGCVFHVLSGRGASIVNGRKYAWGPKDTFSAPAFADIEHRSADDAPAFLIRIHDAPLQEKLGYYEERVR